MRLYTKTVEFCGDCPHCYVVGTSDRCAAAGQKTDGYAEPPIWCPLPDADEEACQCKSPLKCTITTHNACAICGRQIEGGG